MITILKNNTRKKQFLSSCKAKITIHRFNTIFHNEFNKQWFGMSILCRHLNSLTNNIKTIIKKLNNNSAIFFNSEWLFLEVGIMAKSSSHIVCFFVTIYVPVEYSLSNKIHFYYSQHLYINFVDCQKVRRIVNHKVQHDDASHRKSEWKNIFCI